MTKKNDENIPLRDKIKEQVLAIRDTGETNMFDYRAVQAIAAREGYTELEWYIGNCKDSYFNFILTGDEENVSNNE